MNKKDQAQTPEQDLYYFEGFTLDPVKREFRDAGDCPIRLSSRAFDTLTVLVQHAGEVVSKSRLLETVWPNTVVDENNINQAVSAVRKVLGEKSTMIITVPGRGYSFVGKVRKSAPDVPSPEPDGGEKRAEKIPVPRINTAIVFISLFITVMSLGLLYWNLNTAAGSSPPEPVSLAILPMTVSGSAKEDALSAAGRLTDELINQFTLIDKINVSSLPLLNGRQEASGSLPVDQGNTTHTLDGTVRIENGNITITMQLIENKSDYYLWSDSYTFPYDGNTAPLKNISHTVVNATLETLNISQR